MPANRFLPQQPYAASQPGEIYPLPTNARQHTAVDRILHNLFNRMSGTDRGFKCIQRCRLTNAINT